jgi:hypothetical protein
VAEPIARFSFDTEIIIFTVVDRARSARLPTPQLFQFRNTRSVIRRDLAMRELNSDSHRNIAASNVSMDSGGEGRRMKPVPHRWAWIPAMLKYLNSDIGRLPRSSGTSAPASEGANAERKPRKAR